MNKTFARVVAEWHKSDSKREAEAEAEAEAKVKAGEEVKAKARTFTNTPPTDASSFGRHVDTHCWHCRLHNPLYFQNPSPPSSVSEEDLYLLAVCTKGEQFSSDSTYLCASGVLSFLIS